MKAKRKTHATAVAATLTFKSLGMGVEFEIKSGILTIHDPDDAWAKMYSLTSAEALQLAAWIKRECIKTN